MQVRIQAMNAEYADNTRTLERSDTHQHLSSLESKLSFYEQSNHKLRTYIRAKGRESDYAAAVDQVGQTLNDLNQLVIESTRYPVALS